MSANRCYNVLMKKNAVLPTKPQKVNVYNRSIHREGASANEQEYNNNNILLIKVFKNTQQTVDIHKSVYCRPKSFCEVDFAVLAELMLTMADLWRWSATQMYEAISNLREM